MIEQQTDDIEALIELAERGDIDQGEFVQRMKEVVTAALILSMALGAGMPADTQLAELSPMQRLKVEEAQGQAVESARNLYMEAANCGFSAIEGIRDEDKAREKIVNRAIIWGAALGFMWSFGATSGTVSDVAPKGQLMEWFIGLTTEHCVDCLRLNGQIHYATDWLNQSLLPQARALSCKGYNCDCELQPVVVPDGVDPDTIVRGGF